MASATTSSLSRQPSLLDVRGGLRFRKRRPVSRLSELEWSLPTRKDCLSYYLIQSSFETFLPTPTLVHRNQSSPDFIERSHNATSWSCSASTTTAT